MNRDVTIKMEYSPLNKFSSSEEVEQYSLPAPSVTPVRSKRRRKRREYDSLKAHAVDSGKILRRCTCSSCIMSIVIILLLVFISALAVVVYYMSSDVAKMQNLIDNMHIAEKHSSLKYVSLQKESDDLYLMMQKLAATLQNVNSSVNHLELNVTSISALVHKSLSTASSKDTSPAVQSIEHKLAAFGSELTSVKGDLATLRQKELSIEHRIEEIDASILPITPENTSVAFVSPSLCKLANILMNYRFASNWPLQKCCII